MKSIVTILIASALLSCMTIDIGRFKYVEFESGIDDVSKADMALAAGEIQTEHCIGPLDVEGLNNMQGKLLQKASGENPGVAGLSDFLLYSQGLCMKIKGQPVQGRRR